jgi:hypothetical protein
LRGVQDSDLSIFFVSTRQGLYASLDAVRNADGSFNHPLTASARASVNNAIARMQGSALAARFPQETNRLIAALVRVRDNPAFGRSWSGQKWDAAGILEKELGPVIGSLEDLNRKVEGMTAE